MILRGDDQSKNAQPLLLLLSWGFSLGLWRQFTSHGRSLEFRLRLGLVLAKNHGNGIHGLDAMHLHKVPPLGNVVDVSVPVLGSLESLVLLVHEDDVLPLGEEVSGLLPQVRYRRHEILEGGVVGVVHEEGVHSHGQQRALRGQKTSVNNTHGNSPREPYHGDKGMQQSAVPEPMCPRSLGRHKPRVTLLVLGSNLLLGQRRAVVLRHRVSLEPGSMRGRIELGRLLQHNGLVGRYEADVDVLREGDPDATPERPLQRQQEARDDCSRHHCDGLPMMQKRGRSVVVISCSKKAMKEKKKTTTKTAAKKLWHFFFSGSPAMKLL